jgi:hypothetical protein
VQLHSQCCRCAVRPVVLLGCSWPCTLPWDVQCVKDVCWAVWSRVADTAVLKGGLASTRCIHASLDDVWHLCRLELFSHPDWVWQQQMVWQASSTSSCCLGPWLPAVLQL